MKVVGLEKMIKYISYMEVRPKIYHQITKIYQLPGISRTMRVTALLIVGCKRISIVKQHLAQFIL
jgi:hypothetical protein